MVWRFPFIDLKNKIWLWYKRTNGSFEALVPIEESKEGLLVCIGQGSYLSYWSTGIIGLAN